MYADFVSASPLRAEGLLLSVSKGLFTVTLGKAVALLTAFSRTQTDTFQLQLACRQRFSPRAAILSAPNAFHAELAQVAESAMTVFPNAIDSLYVRDYGLAWWGLAVRR